MDMPPLNTPPTGAGAKFASEWGKWFSALWNAAFGPTPQLQPITHFTTPNRPTANVVVGWSGFEDTLGKPVWVKSLGPIVWVDGTGAVV